MTGKKIGLVEGSSPKDLNQHKYKKGSKVLNLHKEERFRSGAEPHSSKNGKRGDLNQLKSEDFFSKMGRLSSRAVVYGVTDRRDDPLWLRIYDFFVDQADITFKEKGLFFRSLYILVNSGMRSARAIEMLAEKNKNLHFSRVLNTIAYEMMNQGAAFSKVMQKYPATFSGYEINMVKAGEMSGKMRDSLRSIATDLQKYIELKASMRSALLYPVTVFIAVILAIVVIMIFVIPKFKEMFADFDIDLPIYTQVLLNISDFFVGFWWLVLLVVFTLWQLFQNWKSTEVGKYEWDSFLLRMPVFSTLINNIQTVHVSRNLSALLFAGVPVNKALEVLSGIVENSVISKSLLVIDQKVRSGATLHQAFLDESCMDPILGEVIEVGEQGGSTAEVLGQVGAQYEVEVDHQMKNMTTLLEPIVVLVVGIVVAFMALAILSPIFELQNAFSN